MMNECKHCSEPVGGDEDFCCQGCDTAYHIIKDLGLGRYYQTRSLVEDEKALIPDEESLEVSMTRFVLQNKSGQYELNLFVEGIHCASCVWLIESALNQQENIVHARLNMSTRRLHIVWNGRTAQGDEYIHLIQSMGYRLMPFNPETLETRDKAELRFLLRCLGVSGFAAGNLMMLSVGLWTTSAEIMGMATRDFLHLISAVIGVPTALYAGQPFIRSALGALRYRRTNMDVPITIAILLTLGISLYELSRSGEHVFFDSIVMLVFFLLIGRYLDIKAKGKARSAAKHLLQLMSGAATVLESGKQRIIPVNEIEENMVVLVSAGEKIMVDGVVLEGESEVDASIITGESLPKVVKEGDNVYTGMLNIATSLKVRVSAAGSNSVLAEIIRLMENAEKGKAHYVRLADRAASYYTPVVHILALLTFLGWLFIANVVWQKALLIAATVLIITCPCALGLAVPVVQVVASGRLMKQGILLKTGVALEKLEHITHVVFDKTGTLTEGNLTWVNGYDVAESDLKIAASMAVKSKHPLSQAIASAYKGELYDIAVEEVPGKGLVSGEYRLGKKTWVCDEDILDSSSTIEIWLRKAPQEFVCFQFSDVLRDDAVDVVTNLKKQSTHVVLLSGDRLSIVSDVAQKVGIDEFYADRLPVEKVQYLQQLQSEGKHVLFVGDGLNDAPSLAEADVSISPATAADISQNAADIVFQGSKLSPVMEVWYTARKSTQLIKQNFILAIIYNIIAVPIAIAGYVTPLVAAIAMSASSLIVIGNALRLRKN